LKDLPYIHQLYGYHGTGFVPGLEKRLQIHPAGNGAAISQYQLFLFSCSMRKTTLSETPIVEDFFD